MSTASEAPSDLHSTSVPLEDVERALNSHLKTVQAPGQLPAVKARMSNLVIFCAKEEQADRIRNFIPEIVGLHPARVLLLIGEAAQHEHGVAEVSVWCQAGGRHRACSEQVTVRASGAEVDRLPFVVRGLLIGDLPINIWWANPLPPPLAGALLYDLAESAQQVIYDSLGWANPHRGVAATAAWLNKFERGGGGAWRVASDLNWRRLKYWRRILTQAFDPAINPGALETVTDLQVEHGPHAVTQAWQLVGWLASRMNWRVQTSRVQPGVEIDWIVKHPTETQALTNAIVATLKWIHSHTPEEIMAKVPENLIGPDKGLYLAALKNTIPMYSTTGRMDPKGAQAVLDVFSQSSPEVKNAKIDLSKTFTNKYVDQANQKMGMKQQ